MKTTTQCLDYLSTHPWLKKGFSKLKQDEKIILQIFLDRSLGDAQISTTELNRLFIDKPKSKNHLIIAELLSSAISYRFS